jgi:hypothetical protein
MAWMLRMRKFFFQFGELSFKIKDFVFESEEKEENFELK